MKYKIKVDVMQNSRSRYYPLVKETLVVSMGKHSKK